MQKKTWYSILGVDAKALSTKFGLLSLTATHSTTYFFLNRYKMNLKLFTYLNHANHGLDKNLRKS